MAYSEKDIDRIFNDICLEISENSLSLNSALKLDNTPSFTTFYKWIDSDKKKMEKYARSCSKRFDNIFEDILRIADDQEGDTYKNEDGIDVVNHNVINRARLRVDSRKWMLGKMNPKKYSDKIQIDTSEFKEQPLFPDVPADHSNK